MKYHYRFSAFCIGLASFFSTYAQTDGNVSNADAELLGFVKNVNAFNYLYPQEKVYLHFDNTGYFIGETMWFKAYVVSGTDNTPTKMSGVLYVELLTPEGQIVQSNKLKIVDGQADGQFALSRVMTAGYYEVRAYTRMMLNWGEDAVFSRVFPIFDQPKTVADFSDPKMSLQPQSISRPMMRPKAESLKKMNMTFYPEGGYLVRGLQSQVAFKVFNSDGAGENAEGRVYNKKTDEVVTTFKVMHGGIGTFSFLPSDDKYVARLTVGDKEYEFELPEVEKDGYVLSANMLRGEKAVVSVQRSAGVVDEPVALAISNGGTVYAFEKVAFNADGLYMLSIDKAALRDGVNQIILFNREGKAICRRMVFKRPASTLQFVQKQDKETYKPFEKISMDFSLSDTGGKPVQTTFSLSVRDASKNTPGSDTGNALANLLLSSELKGFIEDVDYYFESDDMAHNIALDQLMLTQGWCRYSWEQMIRPSDFKVEHYIEEGLVIKGKLLSTFRKKIKEGIDVGVVLYDEKSGAHKNGHAVTDSLGDFAFQSEDFYGTWKMNITTREDGKMKEMNVHLDRQFSPDARRYQPLDTWMIQPEKKTVPGEEGAADGGTDNDNYVYRGYEKLLPSVTVNAEKRWMKGRNISIANVVYDLEEERTRMDDTGEYYLESVFDYLERQNKHFSTEMVEDGNGRIRHRATYRGRPVRFIIDNKERTVVDIEDITANDIEAILISDTYGVAQRFMNSSRDSIEGSYDARGLNESAAASNPSSSGDANSSLSGESNTDNNTASSGNVATQEINNTVLVFVYTDWKRSPDKKGVRKTLVQGFSKPLEFYSPEYEGMVLPDEHDYRRTLYWNPNVKTDALGKASVVFYNNEDCRVMDVDAAAVSASGDIGVFEK